MKFIVTILLLFSVLIQADPKQCTDFYEYRRGLEYTFLSPAKNEMNLKLIGVPYHLPILNQGTRGFCWLYSTFENLVSRVMNKTGSDPGLSLHYLSYYHWLENAINTAKNVKATSVEEGGNLDRALELMRKKGVITDKEYTEAGGSNTIQLPAENALEMPMLKALVQESHRDKSILESLLKPSVAHSASPKDLVKYYSDLYSDPNFKILLGQLIKRKEVDVKNGKSSFSAEMIQILKDGLKSDFIPTQNFSGKQLDLFFEAIDKDIENNVTVFFNRMYFKSDRNLVEEKIDLEAAKSRAAQLFPEINKPSVYFVVSSNRNQKPEVVEVDENAIAIALTANDVKRTIRALHRQGLPVSLIYDHQDNFVSMNNDQDPHKDGVMSVKRTKSWPIGLYRTLRERTMESVKHERAGHLVVTTGTYMFKNKSGVKAIAGFLVPNSWGTKVGKDGYFYVDQSFFGAFADATTVFHSDVVGNAEILKILGPELAAKLSGGIDVFKKEHEASGKGKPMSSTIDTRLRQGRAFIPSRLNPAP